MNTVNLIGRLVRDCELRYSSSGKAVCNFTLAVQEDFKGKDGNYGVNFIEVVCWGKAAEFVAERCGNKGLRVGVVGSLKQNTWQDRETGKTRNRIVVNATKVEPIDWANQSEPKATNDYDEGYSMDSNDFRDEDSPF